MGDNMKLYIKVYFNSESISPLEIIKSIKEMGFEPVVGDYDFMKNFETPEEYGLIVEELHETLKGTGIFYRLSTRPT
jgi:hypothetical protein